MSNNTEQFGGRIGRTMAGSESWWPDRATPPTGAPNVIIMVVDDLGWSDLGCFGSEIPTPNLDRVAGDGLQFTNFHVTPMCSPSRASLLTGIHPHRAGMGTVAQSDPGFPGYAHELRDDVITIAEVLRDNGYATAAVGKWHLAKDSDISHAGPMHSWPCQRGFDRYYGFLGPFTNLFHPNQLVQDNTIIHRDTYPNDYYFTDDITDRSIRMFREVKTANPTKPMFLYFAHGAVHAPLHAKHDDIAKYRGRYQAGWDALKASRFARQEELGVLPSGTVVSPRNTEREHDVRAWDDLSANEQMLFARHMEIYAAMVDNIDQNVGRLLAGLEELGELDNTIFMFMSDNGASREGEVTGTSAYYVHLLEGDDLDADIARIDDLGGPQTTPHYPRGWAMASNTPWRLFKCNTHAGGQSSPMLMHWPAGQLEAGTRRGQYTYVTDVFPTLLELIGVSRPKHRQGVELRAIQGSSFAPVVRDAAAPRTHAEHYVEMNGHRGYYRDGWEIVTLHLPLTPFNDEEWELYHLDEDPTELHNLAAEQPEKLRELADAWEQAARFNDVYPLDEGSSIKYLIRPEWHEQLQRPITIPRGTPTLERWRASQFIWFRGFDVHIDLEHQTGSQGWLIAHGCQGAGYGLYVLNNEVVFVHNNGRGATRTYPAGPIKDRTPSVDLSFVATPQRRWDVSVTIGTQAHTSIATAPMLFGIAPFEGIDVGICRRSPVSWDLYQRFGTFAYTGTIRSARYTPGEPGPDSPDTLFDIIRNMGARYE